MRPAIGEVDKDVEGTDYELGGRVRSEIWNGLESRLGCRETGRALGSVVPITRRVRLGGEMLSALGPNLCVQELEETAVPEGFQKVVYHLPRRFVLVDEVTDIVERLLLDTNVVALVVDADIEFIVFDLLEPFANVGCACVARSGALMATH